MRSRWPTTRSRSGSRFWPISSVSADKKGDQRHNDRQADEQSKSSPQKLARSRREPILGGWSLVGGSLIVIEFGVRCSFRGRGRNVQPSPALRAVDQDASSGGVDARDVPAKLAFNILPHGAGDPLTFHETKQSIESSQRRQSPEVQTEYPRADRHATLDTRAGLRHLACGDAVPLAFKFAGVALSARPLHFRTPHCSPPQRKWLRKNDIGAAYRNAPHQPLLCAAIVSQTRSLCRRLNGRHRRVFLVVVPFFTPPKSQKTPARRTSGCPKFDHMEHSLRRRRALFVVTCCPVTGRVNMDCP